MVQEHQSSCETQVAAIVAIALQAQQGNNEEQSLLTTDA
jgi:hypothetical protein